MKAYDVTYQAVRTAIKGLCRPTITGLENVPETGSFIVASNHLSFLDSVIIQALMPRPVSFFAKAEYFTTPGVKGRLMKSFFTAVRSIPVERGEQAEAVAALKTLLGILEKGDGVGIYPEGTRSRDGRLYRGRTGVGWLALASGAPVVPVGLIGTERLQPADKNWIRPQHFTMRIGAPLQFEHLGQKHALPARRQATEAVMDSIAALTGQPRSDKYNERPAAAV